MKDLWEGFGGFKSVRLNSPENSRLPRSFKDRASHTNKPDKSNNDKVPTACNHSSSETTVEQKINTPVTQVEQIPQIL